MPLRFSVLASGSTGNASLLSAAGFGVLIDAGLGPRQLAARLARVSASWQDVHAVLLSHIHGDHWNERTFGHLQRLSIPLYCHAEHQQRLADDSPAFAALRMLDLVRTYEPEAEIMLGRNLCCRPIPVSHDGGMTCGFRFQTDADFLGQSCSLGYATDLGSWDVGLVRSLGNVDALALEFNHDLELELQSGRSPALIARVLGDEGHLSNEQAASLTRAIIFQSAPGKLRHLIQLHLSRECNRPALARGAAQAVLAEQEVAIHTARQNSPGPILRLGINNDRRRRTVSRPKQNGNACQQPCFPEWE